MKKYGFTLIELLGVIIVLGILVFITAPVVMNTIEESKKNSAIRSAEQLIKTAILDYTTNDNFTTERLDLLSYVHEGKKPESGYIQFNENEKMRFYMVQNGYCVAKRYDSELVATKLEDTDICDWYTSPNTVRQETTGSLLTTVDLQEANLLNYKIYGNSYQETRSGKNLFDKNKVNKGNNATLSIDENGFTLSDNAKASYPAGYIDIPDLPSGKYTLSGKFEQLKTTTMIEVSPRKYSSIYESYKWFGSTEKSGNIKVTFEIPEGEMGTRIYFYSNSTDKLLDVSVKFMDVQLEAGEEATSYEEYGKIPNLDYPSEIQSIGKYNTETKKYEIPIKVTGKNLMKSTSIMKHTAYGVTIKHDLNASTFSLTGNCDTTSNVPQVLGMVGNNFLPGKYQIKIEGTDNLQYYYIQGLKQGGSWATIQSSLKINNSYTLNIQEAVQLRIGLTLKPSASYNNDEYKVIIQPESSSSDITYEPYIEENYKIELDEPLRCVGEVCDYIDYENGEVVRKIDVLEIKNATNFGILSNSTTENTMGVYYFNSEIIGKFQSPKFKDNIIISHFKESTQNVITQDDSLAGYFKSAPGANPPYIGFRIPFTTIKEWDDYLKEQATNNIPMTVQYELIDQITKKIELPEIELFEGVNNITVNDGNLSASKIELVAIKK